MRLLPEDSSTGAGESGMSSVPAWRLVMAVGWGSSVLFCVASHPAGGWVGLLHSMMIMGFPGGKEGAARPLKTQSQKSQVTSATFYWSKQSQVQLMLVGVRNDCRNIWDQIKNVLSWGCI